MLGIYKITNTANGKVYIGSSINIDRRLSNHLSRLRTGKHKSPHLQRAFNKYGETIFEFSVLEEVSEENNLLVREDYSIDLYKSTDRLYGYNSYTATRRVGFKHSEETKRKISSIQRGRKLSLEHRNSISRGGIGKHALSMSDRKRIGTKNRRKHMSEDVEATIRKLLIEGKLTSCSIAGQFNFSKEVTMRIKRELEHEGKIISNKERDRLIKLDILSNKPLESIANKYNVTLRTVYNKRRELIDGSKEVHGHH